MQNAKRKLTIKIGVQSVVKDCSRAKIDELNLLGASVNEKVFVFKVAMDDTHGVTVEKNSDELEHQEGGLFFTEGALFADVVKHITDCLGVAMHDNNPVVINLKDVALLDEAREVTDFGEEDNLHWNKNAIQLEERVGCD